MKKDTDLYILWTNENPVTAEHMVFMYGINSMLHGWWENVTIIVWGATGPLILENENIQNKVAEALGKDVHIIACKACADKLGVTEELRKMGVAVEYTGELLTDILQSKKALLTI